VRGPGSSAGTTEVVECGNAAQTPVIPESPQAISGTSHGGARRDGRAGGDVRGPGSSAGTTEVVECGNAAQTPVVPESPQAISGTSHGGARQGGRAGGNVRGPGSSAGTTNEKPPTEAHPTPVVPESPQAISGTSHGGARHGGRAGGDLRGPGSSAGTTNKKTTRGSTPHPCRPGIAAGDIRDLARWCQARRLCMGINARSRRFGRDDSSSVTRSRSRMSREDRCRPEDTRHRPAPARDSSSRGKEARSGFALASRSVKITRF
jgi:hypothetical protein